MRGRGGGGFSTGTKWELCRKSPGDTKYVICNADEGDPGAFMDRSILESDPHAVLEGMAIAGYAMGAREGIIYCREEYPLAIDRLEAAIAQAIEFGLLGTNILGTKFSFRHYPQRRRRRVCLRRRNRPHRLHRRPPRRTASASPVPRRQRSLGQAEQHQ